MRSEPICAYIYINGEIIQSSSANAIFRCDKTKSLLLNPTMILSNIITAIQSSITDNGVTPIINTLCYRCPVYQLNDEVQYRAIQIIDEEGVS